MLAHRIVRKDGKREKGKERTIRDSECEGKNHDYGPSHPQDETEQNQSFLLYDGIVDESAKAYID